MGQLVVPQLRIHNLMTHHFVTLLTEMKKLPVLKYVGTEQLCGVKTEQLPSNGSETQLRRTSGLTIIQAHEHMFSVG